MYTPHSYNIDNHLLSIIVKEIMLFAIHDDKQAKQIEKTPVYSWRADERTVRTKRPI